MDGFIDSKLYDEIKKVIPVLCVDLVLHKDNSVLLCKRLNEPAKGLYWIPGGRVFKNETMADAVRRKAREELGISVDIERLIDVYDWFWDSIHTPSATYLVTTSDWDNIRLDAQHEKYIMVDSLLDNRIPDLLFTVLKDSKVLKGG